MPLSSTYNRTLKYGSLSFNASATIESPLATPWSVTLGTAKPGTLTTRTDDDTGTVTMTGGHGLSTGRMDVYWATGSRYGMTGTVTVNSIAIDGGAGDNLPIATTALTLIAPTSEPVTLTGDNCVSLGVNCPAGGRVVFADASNATIFAVPERSTTNTSYVWTSGDGGTNPLAGGAVAKVFLSQPSSTLTPDMTGVVQFS